MSLGLTDRSPISTARFPERAPIKRAQAAGQRSFSASGASGRRALGAWRAAGVERRLELGNAHAQEGEHLAADAMGRYLNLNAIPP